MENTYFVISTYDGEETASVETRKSLAEKWEQDDICGIGIKFVAFKYENGKMTEVDVEDIAREYLHERKEIEDEYRDYCETVEEYGYDFDQDQLEMGFNPYLGDYDNDC